jgi:hypothetical protein
MLAPLSSEFLDQIFMLQISKEYPRLSDRGVVVCGIIFYGS